MPPAIDESGLAPSLPDETLPSRAARPAPTAQATHTEGMRCSVVKIRRIAAGIATGLALLSAGSGFAQSTPATASTPVDRLAQLTVDTVATRFAALEMERPVLLIRLVPEHSAVRALDQRREILCDVLRSLPHGVAGAQEDVSRRVVEAIERRLAGLTIDRRFLIMDRGPGHSEVRAVEGMIAALERRRTELQSPGGVGLCGASPPEQR